MSAGTQRQGPAGSQVRANADKVRSKKPAEVSEGGCAAQTSADQDALDHLLEGSSVLQAVLLEQESNIRVTHNGMKVRNIR